jgi:hypothetical protein
MRGRSKRVNASFRSLDRGSLLSYKIDINPGYWQYVRHVEAELRLSKKAQTPEEGLYISRS